MNELSQYGLSGVCIIGMAAFVMYLMKAHKEEREEWRKSQERRDEESNRNIRENTNILSALKTIIETIKR